MSSRLFDVADALDHVFGFAEFEHAPAHVVVRFADGHHEFGQRDVVGEELVRVHVHLIFANEPADAGDFRNAGRVLQVVAQRPVLKRAQIGETVLAGLIHQRVFIDPADARGVRPQRGPDARRQIAHDLIEIFQHARARPIHVRAVLEDDVHERQSEEGLTPHIFDVRRGRQHADDGISDLILDQLRIATRPFGEHDHLHVGQIGNGIQAHALDGDDAGDDEKHDAHHHQKLIVRTPADDAFDNRFLANQPGGLCRSGVLWLWFASRWVRRLCVFRVHVAQC